MLTKVILSALSEHNMLTVVKNININKLHALLNADIFRNMISQSQFIKTDDGEFFTDKLTIAQMFNEWFTCAVSRILEAVVPTITRRFKSVHWVGWFLKQDPKLRYLK